MGSISSLIRDMYVVLRKNQGPHHSLVVSRRSHPWKGEPGARGLQSPRTAGAGRWPEREEWLASPAFCPILGELRGGRAPTPDFHTGQERGPRWRKEAGPRASKSNRRSRQAQRGGGGGAEPPGGSLSPGGARFRAGLESAPWKGPGSEPRPRRAVAAGGAMAVAVGRGAAGAALGPELGGRLFCSSAGPIAVAST